MLAAVTAASWPAYAHHSFAMYDRTKVLTLKGNVKSFQWTNPHCVIWVLVQPEGGGEPQEWSFETTSPGVLTRGGWTRNSVKPGDRVAVEFYPLRDGSHGGGLSRSRWSTPARNSPQLRSDKDSIRKSLELQMSDCRAHSRSRNR